MLRDPDLIPEPWRWRQRFRPHPLLALPLFPLVGLLVMLASAIDEPSVQAWVWVAHLLALTLVASVASAQGGVQLDLFRRTLVAPRAESEGARTR